jgi:hypothetical protein
MDRRLGTLAFATALAFAAAPPAPASGQVICQKVSNGSSFKLRNKCKEGKEVQVVDLGSLPRTLSFGSTGEIETVTHVPSLVRIDGSFSSFGFDTTAPSDLHITFSAECSMLSNVVGAQTEVTLILDGQPIAPTGGSGGFCANPSALFVGGVTASRTVVVPDVVAGGHVFEVSASTSTELAVGALDEISTSILVVGR